MSLNDQAANFKKKVSSQVVDLKPRVSNSARPLLGLNRKTEDRIRLQAEQEARDKQLARDKADEEDDSETVAQTEPELVAKRLSTRYAIVNLLKEHRTPKSIREIYTQLGITSVYDEILIEDLKMNEKIQFNANDSTFEYKPNFKVETADQLYEQTREKYYLNMKKDNTMGPIGIELKDMEDTAVDVKPLAEQLIVDKRILAIRGKDGNPRAIFYNDYTDPCDMDREFKKAWFQMQTPGDTDLMNALKQDGLKYLDAFEHKQIDMDHPIKKTRKSKANVMKTNTHME